MLDIDKIRQLIEMMVTNDLVEISLRDGDVEVSLRRPNDPSNAAAGVAVTRTPTLTTTETPGNAVELSTSTAEPPALLEIVSPMVGTFYASADPDSPPFVQVGSSIGPGTVVCLLEAMKVFNEIKAEVSGVVERILVKNTDAVEYGQALFLVRPT